MRNPQKKPKTPRNKDTNFTAKSVNIPPRWVEGLALSTILGATILVFAESITAEFTFDDFRSVLDDPNIRHMRVWELFDFGDINFGWRRQVRTFSYMVDYALFGSSPVGYHLHNLFWHVLSVTLFYVVVRKLSQQVWISLLAALIFAIHPIHVESVTNITNRKDLLCMAFLLAAFISYDWFVRDVGKKRWLWLTGSFVAWVLALFSKQVAIVFPLSLIVYEFLYVPQNQRMLTRNRLLLTSGILLGGFLFLTLVLLIVDLENLQNSLDFKGYQGEPSVYSVGLTSARAFWGYVELLIWPNELCPDHLVQLSRSFLEPRTLLSWVGLIAIVVLAFQVAERSPLLSFGLFWFLISYLPVSNLIPTTYILADRYMYIPSAGFCIVMVSIGGIMYQKVQNFRPNLAIPVMSLVGIMIVAGYTLRTLEYNAIWKKGASLWQYTLQCNPQSFRAYTNLGIAQYLAGSHQEALDTLTKALKLGSQVAFNDRGNVYQALGNSEAALKDFNQGIELMPEWAKGYYDRGVLFYSLGKYHEAILDFNQALKFKPKYSEAYNNRGLAYENLDLLREALQDYSRAVEIDPFNAAAHNNLGRVLFYLGNLEEAIQHYERAEQLGLSEATKVLEALDKEGLLNGPENLKPAVQTP